MLLHIHMFTSSLCIHIQAYALRTPYTLDPSEDALAWLHEPAWMLLSELLLEELVTVCLGFRRASVEGSGIKGLGLQVLRFGRLQGLGV